MTYIRQALAQPSLREVVAGLIHGTAEFLSTPDNPRGCLLIQGALACGTEAEHVKLSMIDWRKSGEAADLTRDARTFLNCSMKMRKFTSLNSDFDLDGIHFLKWLKDSKASWNTFNTTVTVSISFLQPTISSLKARHRAECLASRGQAAKLLAGVSATYSSFEMAEYRACTSILILTMQARMRRGFDGVRIVSGESDDHASGDFSGA
jgi:hypothetical protein